LQLASCIASIVDGEHHIFLAVLGGPGLRWLAKFQCQSASRLRPYERLRLELAASGPRAIALRIRAPALGLEILINMRGPPSGLKREEAATASASSPDPVGVVIDDWLKSSSAFGLG
jgi:hypothetical protein